MSIQTFTSKESIELEMYLKVRFVSETATLLATNGCSHGFLADGCNETVTVQW
jgi:hypothetical protein